MMSPGLVEELVPPIQGEYEMVVQVRSTLQCWQLKKVQEVAACKKLIVTKAETTAKSSLVQQEF